jgi:hypothetical protein
MVDPAGSVHYRQHSSRDHLTAQAAPLRQSRRFASILIPNLILSMRKS